MTSSLLIPIVTQVVLLGVAGFVAYYAFVVRVTNRVTAIETRCTAHVETLARVNVISAEMEKVKAQNELFWAVLEPHLAHIIHSPTARSRDELVDKLVQNDITDEEAMELVGHLTEAMSQADWPSSKRLAAALLLTRALDLTKEHL